MSLFAISDLHLSFSCNKSMDIFHGWQNYTERLYSNWNRLVKKDDTVILPGDISWAMRLEQAKEDFLFLNSLPGRKILLKGNHDLWWNTLKKTNEFLIKNNFNTITLLYNNAVTVENYAVCGTRGWMYDAGEDNRIRLREAGRLKRSLEAAAATGQEPLLFLHYPPVYGEYVCEDFIKIIKEFNISTVYYGHIHGAGYNKTVTEYDNISLKLISADCIDFTPLYIPPFKKI